MIVHCLLPSVLLFVLLSAYFMSLRFSQDFAREKGLLRGNGRGSFTPSEAGDSAADGVNDYVNGGILHSTGRWALNEVRPEVRQRAKHLKFRRVSRLSPVASRRLMKPIARHVLISILALPLSAGEPRRVAILPPIPTNEAAALKTEWLTSLLRKALDAYPEVECELLPLTALPPKAEGDLAAFLKTIPAARAPSAPSIPKREPRSGGGLSAVTRRDLPARRSSRWNARYG